MKPRMRDLTASQLRGLLLVHSHAISHGHLDIILGLAHLPADGKQHRKRLYFCPSRTENNIYAKNVRFTIQWRYVANIHKLASSEIRLCLALELVILVRSRAILI